MLKTVSSITNAIGALNFKGTWNAATNTPTIVSGVGVKGDYFVVSVAGSTTIDGISNWGIGDWITYNGAVWQRVEGGADLNGVNLSVSGTTTLSNLTASTALALDASKNVASVTNTGTGNNVLADGPTLTTPTLGVASATSINKVALTAPATGSTLTIADGKTLTANHSLTLAGTDATTMTFPTTSATIARTDVGQTFTGNQSIAGTLALSGLANTDKLQTTGFTYTNISNQTNCQVFRVTKSVNYVHTNGVQTNVDIPIITVNDEGLLAGWVSIVMQHVSGTANDYVYGANWSFGGFSSNGTSWNGLFAQADFIFANSGGSGTASAVDSSGTYNVRFTQTAGGSSHSGLVTVTGEFIYMTTNG